MQLAILHHHLNRGGVTTVIANHLRSLATLPDGEKPERVVVFFDGQRDGWPDDLPPEMSIALVDEPALGYDEAGADADPIKLADILCARFTAAGVLPGDTLLHVHNHSLGKNASLPGALAHLAGDGWRMLLQIHDFAEDNRPENYQHLREATGISDPDELGEILYPQAPGIHYATLTERDAEILRAAGIPDERLHTLPNPVHEFGSMLSPEVAKTKVYPLLGLPPTGRLIVYPVRGIRRKNLGEMLLLAALAPEGTYFAVTLAPKNPIERASFDRWKYLAEELDLPCLFDTGGAYSCDFNETLAAADAILTTSVAEGFGMVFLEAWLVGKPLVGRDLPEITREFKAAGIIFDGLIDSITCPPDWDEDFGKLKPVDQEGLIDRVAKEPKIAEAVASLNRQLLSAMTTPPTDTIEANAAIVRSVYSAEAIGSRLAKLYSFDRESDCSEVHINGRHIHKHFRHPERLYPVRSEVFPERPSLIQERILELSQMLEPQPTEEQPVLPKLRGIRSVIFDVYGTLLVSGSGDISLASEGGRGEAAVEALRVVVSETDESRSRARQEATEQVHDTNEGSPTSSLPNGRGADLDRANSGATPATDIDGSPVDGEAIVAALYDAIRAAHAKSSSDYPEVEIRDIWRTVLKDLDIRLNDVQIERLAVEYECRVNPIWPMPGLEQTLDELSKSGPQLGIVSNAQFFTPLAFEPLSGKPLPGWGFDPNLCIWSYEHREAKPGTYLYQRCAEALAARGIAPEQALYVGNDLRNDIWPAQQIGFKTALFAGDARSLRWRRNDPRVADVRPDAVITDLRQVLEIAL